MDQVVITIARQYGSGGRTVGKMLAKRLDIPCYDREIISLASEESGIHPTLFQDEKKKHGSLRAFLTGGFKNASPLSPESAGFTKDDNLFRYQAKIIRGLADEESCVIIGRCADYILRKNPALVRVFVLGDTEAKIKRTAEREGISEDKAKIRMEQADKRRKYFHNTHSENKWGDSRSYDITVNSSKLGLDCTAELLIKYIELRNAE